MRSARSLPRVVPRVDSGALPRVAFRVLPCVAPPTARAAAGLALCSLLGACGAGLHATRPTIHLTAEAPPDGATPPRLTASVFHKPEDRKNLTEADIARVLDAPVEPEFPARAGVVVLSAPFSPAACAPTEPGDRAPQKLAQALQKSDHFELVSDISPHLARAQSIEALREVAVRYRLKYLVVLTRSHADRSGVNPWGWAWLTVVGIPFAPAYTLRTAGVFEATLMDVRTGTFLFTTQIHMRAHQRVTPFHTEEKLASLRRRASEQAAERLSKRFVEQVDRVVAAHLRGVRKRSVPGAPKAPADGPAGNHLAPGPVAGWIRQDLPRPRRGGSPRPSSASDVLTVDS